MKQELIMDVMQHMMPFLDNAQLQRLRQAMDQALFRYNVSAAAPSSDENGNEDLLVNFIAAKRIEGCSEKTLHYYHCTITAMIEIGRAHV